MRQSIEGEGCEQDVLTGGSQVVPNFGSFLVRLDAQVGRWLQNNDFRKPTDKTAASTVPNPVSRRPVTSETPISDLIQDAFDRLAKYLKID